MAIPGDIPPPRYSPDFVMRSYVMQVPQSIERTLFLGNI